MAEVISSYAQKENIAYWDLYTITGGYNSCKSWYDANLFGRDRVHFSREGYYEQGTLLYKAIVRSCIYEQYKEPDEFITDRFPTQLPDEQNWHSATEQTSVSNSASGSESGEEARDVE